jgi:transposase
MANEEVSMVSLFVKNIEYKKTGHIKIQICSNTREGKKVKQKCIRHIGTAHNEEEYKKLYRLAAAFIDSELKKINKSEVLFDSFDVVEEFTQIDPKKINKFFKKKSISEENNDAETNRISIEKITEEKRLVDGTYEFYGKLFNKFKFERLFKNKKYSDLLKNLLVERISNPKSKLKTRKNILNNNGFCTSMKSLYKFMDVLDSKYEEILNITYGASCSLFENKINMVFFDVTTLYFESINDDDLRKFGYSKDQKFHSVQVTLALATTEEGVPIGYKLFPGNTAEISTLISCIEEWKNNLPINDVTFVCDRGLFSINNLKIIVDKGYKFIVAMPLRKLNIEVQQEILEDCNSDNFNYKIVQLDKGGDIYWTKEIAYKQYGKEISVPASEGKRAKYTTFSIPGRIISTYNSSRARKDQKDRQRIIDKLKVTLGVSTEGTASKTLKAVTNSGYKKYLSENTSGLAEIDLTKIEVDAKWDGIHGLFTNTDLSALEAIKRYKNLVRIEDSFRLSKSFIKMRPIYHYKSSRIRGHIALCYLALCLTKYAEKLLKDAGLNISPDVLREELTNVSA